MRSSSFELSAAVCGLTSTFGCAHSGDAPSAELRRLFVRQLKIIGSTLGTPGEFAWGGAASTAFWIDPVEDMAVVLLAQLMPSSTYPIRRELRVLTYQAIVD